MTNYQDLQRVAKMLMGQGGPNPYMGLDIRGQLGNWWNNFSQNYLPQAHGMNRELFQEWYPDDSQGKYDLMRRYYGM